MASVVDVSLLGVAMWSSRRTSSPAKLYESVRVPSFSRAELPNPLVNIYETKDGRFLTSSCSSRTGTGRICASTSADPS